MPYIKQAERKRLNPFIAKLFDQIFNKGEMTYTITKLIHLWVINKFGLDYKARSEGKSIFVDALREYNRKVMDKHENKAWYNNGNISQLDERTLEDVR